MGHVYRFTLIHDSGTQVISEPEGWANIKITLERDQQYFGIFELFETPMTFYGSNGTIDGGMNFINVILDVYGLNAQIHLKCEIKPNGENDFEDLFLGLLDLSAAKQTDSRRLQIPIIQDDFWSMFKSRSGNSVDINSVKDLDGNNVTNHDSGVHPLQLTAQVVNYRYDAYLNNNYTTVNFGSTSGDKTYHVIDWDVKVFDEILDTYNYSLQESDEIPFEKFYLEYGGSLRIQGGMTLGFDNDVIGKFDLLLQVNGNTPISFTPSTRHVSSTFNDNYGNSTVLNVNVQDFSIDTTFPVSKGDAIRIYLKVIGDTSSAPNTQIVARNGFPHIPQFGFQGEFDPTLGLFPFPVPATGNPSWEISLDGNLQGVPVKKGDIINPKVTSPGQDPTKWNIGPKSQFEGLYNFGDTWLKATQATTTAESTCDAFFLHDVAQKIIERTTGVSFTSPFYSDYLGGIHTLGSYGSDGCATHLMITQGLQIRQYTLADKPFSLSFNDWWNGANPILNLGLCLDEVDGNEVIRIEDKLFFFDDTVFMTLNYVNNIEKSFDLENIFKNIKIGYSNWKSEDISSLDDPQTVHEYSLLFKTIGKELDLQSSFVAASLAWEFTRRTTIQKSADYKFDNNIFVISVKPDETTSPVGGFLPELNENFNSVTNLQNPETRYNIALSPLRNLIRWANFINGCLQKYPTSIYNYTYGEGNFSMISDYSGSGVGLCLAKITDPLAENTDINLTDFPYGPAIGHLFQPIVYTFEYPLTYQNYKLIKANRYKSIRISETNGNYITCKIKKIEYNINKSHATFTLWEK